MARKLISVTEKSEDKSFCEKSLNSGYGYFVFAPIIDIAGVMLHCILDNVCPSTMSDLQESS